jgi:predicted RNA binding protein YcfA (HicA-like mRNA interferase family)
VGCAETWAYSRVESAGSGMSKLEKLIEQFLRDPPEVRFDDVEYGLTAFGFEEKRSKGSHHTFRNTAGLKITVPKKGGKMVKGVYVQQTVSLLNLDEDNDEDAN